MQKLLPLFFLFLVNSAAAQKPKYMYQGVEEEMDVKKLSKWEVKNTKSYTGVYGFDESESEWDLLVIVLDSSVVMQASSNVWTFADIQKEDSWVHKFRTFRPVKLEGNRFTSDSIKGYFVKYDNSPGIVLSVNGKDFDTVEYGGKYKMALSEHFYGDYPSMSYKILDDSYFSDRTKEQLQIMRNEVFARYGMRFTKNGRMYNHFIKKDWYNPWRNNVQDCLTEIEIRNLQTLSKFETAQ